MLAIGIGRFAGKLLVGSEHGAQCVEDVLAGLLAGASLAQSARHLKNACDDPPNLVGRSKEIVKSTDVAMPKR